MRGPRERERARGEFGIGGRFVVLPPDRRPRNDPPGEADPRVVAEDLPRRLQQRILAGAARPDHQHQHFGVSLGFQPGEHGVTWPPKQRRSQSMFTTRPEIAGTFGVVASTHWLASSTGMAVLERGGNAFDAAVATAFVLQVAEPHLNGPGGDAPIILHDAKAGTQQGDLRPGPLAARRDHRSVPGPRASI
jgi:hypothetical protein